MATKTMMMMITLDADVGMLLSETKGSFRHNDKYVARSYVIVVQQWEAYFWAR